MMLPHFSSDLPSFLKVHEWLAVLIFCVLIGGLAFYTSLKGNNYPIPTHLIKEIPPKKGFEVVLKGAIEFPGVYLLPSEITLKSLLEIAQVLPAADLRRFRLDRPIKAGRILNIPIKGVKKKSKVKEEKVAVI